MSNVSLQAAAPPATPEVVALRQEVARQGAEIEHLRGLLRAQAAERGIPWPRLRELIDDMVDAVVIFDSAGETLWANAAARVMTGAAPPLGSESDPLDFTAAVEARYPDGGELRPEDWPVTRALRGERVAGQELRLLMRRTGETFHGLLSTLLVRDGGGQLGFVVLLLYDISERRAVEDALSRSEARFRALLDRARRQLDFDLLLTRLLAGLASASGADIDDLLGSALEEVGRFVGAEHAHVVLLSPRNTFESRYGWNSPGRNLIPVGFRDIPIDGTFSWLVGRLASGETVVINDPEELPPEAAAHRRFLEAQGCKSVLFVPMRGRGGAVRGALWLRSYSRPADWRDEDVARLSMLSDAVANAIDRREAEEALRESERRLRSIATATPTFFLELDDSGTIAFINRTYEGMTDELVLGTRLFDWIRPAERPPLERLFADAFRSLEPQTAEYDLLDLRGRWRTYLATLRAYPERSGAPRRALLTATDVTDWRRTSEALRESEQLLRSLFDNAPVGIFHCSEGGSLLRANPSLARMLGFASIGQLMERVSDVGTQLFQERGLREQVARDAAERGEWISRESQFRRHDGSPLEGRLTLRRVLGPDGAVAYFEGFIEDLTERRRAEEERDQLFRLSVDLFCVSGFDGYLKQWNPAVESTTGWSREHLVSTPWLEFVHPEDRARLVEGQAQLRSSPHFEVEYRFRCRDGTFRWLSWNSHANPAQELVFSVGRDVTERRRQEEAQRQLETQLRQAQKMEGIGRLAGGIAHDFNNILAVILSYASFVKGAVRSDDPIFSDVQEIEIAATRAAELTRQLLAFSRKSIVNPMLIDVNVSLAGLRKMIQRIVGEDVALSFEQAEGLWPVKLDASAIDQVVLNLVVNARDAMPLGGHLTIETANAAADQIAAWPEVPPGDYVRISVSDTGGGISREVMEHLFEPFFTTKKEGKGTGLGLATVYGIVKQGDGHIFVHSEAGRGARFDIFFPRAPAGREPDGLKQVGPLDAVIDATVLLVDDEDALRRIAVRTLQAQGYRVLEAGSANEALARAFAYDGVIDLVISDVVMPGMNGRQMVEQLRLVRPEVAVLYMSGYTDDTIARHGIKETDVHFLQKPFTPSMLLKLVAAVVRGTPRGQAQQGPG